MNRKLRSWAHGLMLLAALGWLVDPVYGRGGRGGGGGARGGFHGGGGARPSMGRTGGGGMSRPAPRPSMSTSRPSFSQARPGGASAGRQFAGGGARPGGAAGGGRPGYAGGAGLGGARPSVGHSASFPNITGGGGTARPGQIAATRPGQIGASRPGQPAARPGQGAIARPGQLPTTRPGQGASSRPGQIAGTRPGERPGGIGTRPGEQGRPWIGSGGGLGNRPGERPMIGSGDRPIAGNNRPVIGGGNTLNNINNRPGWGLGPPGQGNWAGHWHDHWVNPHHWGWYHGCWGGWWGAGWYAPLAYGATAWGLAAASSAWGYGDSYYNPYYTDGGAATAYDYSQPVAPQDYGTATAQAQPDPAAPPSTLDQARSLFLAGDYQGAQTKAEAAVAEDPKDPVAHEFYALCLFAQGAYPRAASVLDSLLAVAPGMDWTTLMSLYPSQSTYLQQFRTLEDYCAAHAQDPSSHFVLAYHLLVRGETRTAIDALQVVVDNQPKDQVAAKMLAALKGADAASAGAADTAAAQPAVESTPPAPAESTDAGPTTDLTGSWQAERGGSKFELKIDDAGQFSWHTVASGGQPLDLSGPYAINGDVLSLESKNQGVMAARVKSKGADSFQFIPVDSPPGDEGLTFTRLK